MGGIVINSTDYSAKVFKVVLYRYQNNFREEGAHLDDYNLERINK